MSRTSEEWSVPDYPNPQEILREASENARDGQYGLALTKHVWLPKQRY